MQIPPLLPVMRPPGWIDRNWKWLVPMLVLFVVACLGGIIVAIMAMMKSSDAYLGAVQRTKSDPTVIAALGSPIKEGFFITGHIALNGSKGTADLAIPVSGPKGAATVYVDASKALGIWQFDALIVQISATHERIDLSDTKKRSTTKAVQ